MIEDGNKERSGHYIGGVILIVLGVLFLLDTLHVVSDFDNVFRFWPVLLIVLGIQRYQTQCKTDYRPRSGLFWIILGSILLASELHVFHFNIWSLVWPGILIWLGVHSLRQRNPRWNFSPSSSSTAGSSSSSNSASFSSSAESGSSARFSGGDPSARIFVTAVLSGFRRQFNSQEFQGGEIKVVMGGCELDLRGASMSGNEAILDITCVMGGIDMRVPEDWTVICRVTPVLAGIDDRSHSPREGTKRLVIEGNLFMGGVDIKN